MLEGKFECCEKTKRGVTIILENGDAATFAAEE